MITALGASSEPHDLGKLLKHLHLSRELVAIQVGVSKESVDNWCTQRTLIDLKHLGPLLRMLKNTGGQADSLRGLLTQELGRHGLSAELLGGIGSPSMLGEQPMLLIGSQLPHIQAAVIGFQQGLHVNGVQNLVCLDACGQKDLLTYYIDLAISSNARGVALVMLPLSEGELSKLAHGLSARRIPCVFIGTGPIDPPPGISVVNMAWYHAAAAATEFLWNEGRRNTLAIALASWSFAISQDSRVRGYKETVERQGGKPNVIWALDPESALELGSRGDCPNLAQAAEMAARDRHIEGIVALSLMATKEIIHQLRIHRRRLGEDVSLVAIGCADWMHDVMSPSVTHVSPPYLAAGSLAARVLLERSVGHLEQQRGQVVEVPLGDEALHEPWTGSVGVSRPSVQFADMRNEGRRRGLGAVPSVRSGS